MVVNGWNFSGSKGQKVFNIETYLLMGGGDIEIDGGGGAVIFPVVFPCKYNGRLVALLLSVELVAIVPHGISF